MKKYAVVCGILCLIAIMLSACGAGSGSSESSGIESKIAGVYEYKDPVGTWNIALYPDRTGYCVIDYVFQLTGSASYKLGDNSSIYVIVKNESNDSGTETTYTGTYDIGGKAIILEIDSQKCVFNKISDDYESLKLNSAVEEKASAADVNSQDVDNVNAASADVPIHPADPEPVSDETSVVGVYRFEGPLGTEEMALYPDSTGYYVSESLFSFNGPDCWELSYKLGDDNAFYLTIYIGDGNDRVSMQVIGKYDIGAEVITLDVDSEKQIFNKVSDDYKSLYASYQNNGGDSPSNNASSSSEFTVKYAIANENINIRIAPGKNNAKVGKIYKGALVEALESQQIIDGYNWYKVEYEYDQFGWIADNGEWLDFDEKRIDSLKGFFSDQLGITKSEYDDYDPMMHMIGQSDEYNIWYGAAEGAFVYFVEDRKTHEFLNSDQTDHVSVILINYYYEGENIYSFKSMRREEDVVFTDPSGIDHDAEVWNVTDLKGNSSRYLYYEVDEGMNECVYKENAKGKFEQIGYSSYY